MPVHHVKGQPAASTYVREKGCLTFYSNHGAPCSYSRAQGAACAHAASLCLCVWKKCLLVLMSAAGFLCQATFLTAFLLLVVPSLLPHS